MGAQGGGPQGKETACAEGGRPGFRGEDTSFSSAPTCSVVLCKLLHFSELRSPHVSGLKG